MGYLIVLLLFNLDFHHKQLFLSIRVLILMCNKKNTDDHKFMEKKIAAKHNFVVNNLQHAYLFQNRDREQIRTP